MSVSYGFYNSKNGDRKYDAIQMSSIFDGIIVDGMLQHYGGRMIVSADGQDMTVRVATGRAWFNHTWTLNDAILPLTVPQSEVIMNRIDAVVIDVDARLETRRNQIMIVKGNPAENPQRPTLVKSREHNQYPLAYITVRAMVNSIRQADIANAVGTSACPYCTAPLEKMDIDELIAQWQDQWQEFYERETAAILATKNHWNTELQTFYNNKTSEINAYFDTKKNEWDTYTETTTLAMDDWFTTKQTEMNDWYVQKQTEWIEWFETIQDVVDENAAVTITIKLLELETSLNTYQEEMVTTIDTINNTISSMDAAWKAGDTAIRNELKNGTLSPALATRALNADNAAHATKADSATKATTADTATKAGNVTGVVAIANGGTGATTAANARKALGLGATTGALPVANGGTGATTAAAARTNLGVAYGTTAGTVCQGNDSRLSNARTPTAHNQAASTITAGALATDVRATNGTDYGTSRLRNIRASTVDLTAGTSALGNGEIYLVYE